MAPSKAATITEKYLRIFGLVAVPVVVLAVLAIMRHITCARPAGPPASEPMVAAAADAHNTAYTALGRLQNVGYTVAPLGQPAAPTRLRVRGGVLVQWVDRLSDSAMGLDTPGGCASVTFAWPKSLHPQGRADTIHRFAVPRRRRLTVIGATLTL